MAIAQGANAIGQSPLWKSTIAGAKAGFAGSVGGQRTNITTSGSSTSINPQGQVTQSSNNLLLLGGAVLALFLLKK